MIIEENYVLNGFEKRQMVAGRDIFLCDPQSHT